MYKLLHQYSLKLKVMVIVFAILVSLQFVPNVIFPQTVKNSPIVITGMYGGFDSSILVGDVRITLFNGKYYPMYYNIRDNNAPNMAHWGATGSQIFSITGTVDTNGNVIATSIAKAIYQPYVINASNQEIPSGLRQFVRVELVFKVSNYGAGNGNKVILQYRISDWNSGALIHEAGPYQAYLGDYVIQYVGQPTPKQ